MKFRLTAPLATSVSVIDEGTEIGDGTPFPMKQTDDKGQVMKDSAGNERWLIPLGSNMYPLDDEAKALYDKTREAKGEQWGRPLDERIDVLPAAASRQGWVEQPPIPGPLEHFMSPNDQKPGERAQSANEVVARALGNATTDEQRAENDKVMAQRANAEAERKGQEARESSASMSQARSGPSSVQPTNTSAPRAQSTPQTGSPPRPASTTASPPKPADKPADANKTASPATKPDSNKG